MFYTGIITSLLPYILFLGVFGTIILNQVFHSQNEKEQPESEFHTLDQPARLEPTQANEDYQVTVEDLKEHHPSDKQAFSPPKPPPASVRLCRINPWKRLYLSVENTVATNRTFSFRGPPTS